MADSFIPRHAEPTVAEAMSDARVVLLNGPRQSGKTTLATRIAERLGRSVPARLQQPSA